MPFIQMKERFTVVGLPCKNLKSENFTSFATLSTSPYISHLIVYMSDLLLVSLEVCLNCSKSAKQLFTIILLLLLEDVEISYKTNIRGKRVGRKEC